MLTENDIVKFLTKFLQKNKYTILQSLSTTEIGVDIIAKNKFETLYIEAKGQTSSKKESSRFGKEFNKNQIKSHISAAILASMKVISNNSLKGRVSTGIALPDTPIQRKVLDEVLPALKKLGVKIFWIKAENEITVV